MPDPEQDPTGDDSNPHPITPSDDQDPADHDRAAELLGDKSDQTVTNPDTSGRVE